MQAPLVDPRTYDDIVAWAEQLASCERAAPGPGLVGAVLDRDVVDPVGHRVVAAADDRVDGAMAEAIGALPWVRIRDLLFRGRLGRDVTNPANRRVYPAGTVVDVALAQVLEDLARVTGPQVLVGCSLGAELRYEPTKLRYRAGTEIDAQLADVIDHLAWVRVASWRPGPAGRPDAGRALVGILGRFAELVVERVNRAPAKHELAFLNLIGTQPVPPRPARVPLTFTLATGSPVDAAVPPGTQVAAIPREGENDGVVFETERHLVVSRAQLQAMYVIEPATDSYADRTTAAIGATADADGTGAAGAADQPFGAFDGTQPTLHQLFIACDDVLTQPGTKEVTLALDSTTPYAWPLGHWPISWAFWDGTSWQPIASTRTPGLPVLVTLSQVPPLVPSTVGGRKAGWLRAQLDMPLRWPGSPSVPTLVAVGDRQRPHAPQFPLDPFGDPANPVRWFYIDVDGAVAADLAFVQLDFTMARPMGPRPRRGSTTLNWEYRAGNEWKLLGRSTAQGLRRPDHDRREHDFEDGTDAFTHQGVITFHVPEDWTRSSFQRVAGRWLRVEIAEDLHRRVGEARIGRITLSHRWEAHITRVEVRVATPSAAQPSAVGAFNASPLDLSKDFRPLGEQPRFNDTFYLAVPEAFARAGAWVKLNLTLTNPVGSGRTSPPEVLTTGEPQLRWEMWDGTVWAPVTIQDVGTVDGAHSAEGSDGPRGLSPEGSDGTQRLSRRRIDSPPRLNLGVTDEPVRLGPESSDEPQTPSPGFDEPPMVRPEPQPARPEVPDRPHELSREDPSTQGPSPEGIDDSSPGPSPEGIDDGFPGPRPEGTDDTQRPSILTASGVMRLQLPPTLAPTSVNGQEATWLRARLVGGNYGVDASYVVEDVNDIPVYRPVPPTFAPPVITSLTFEPEPEPEGRWPMPSACLTYNDFAYQDRTTEAAGGSGLLSPFTAVADREPALYLGFDQPFEPRPTSLYLQVDPPSPEEVAAERLADVDPSTRARLVWEYSSPAGWQPLTVDDETEALARSGLASFIGPSDLTPRSAFGRTQCWLRLRWAQGELVVPPRLVQVVTNTTWASEVTAVDDEILGSSTGQPNQQLTVAQQPVQPGQRLLVRELERPTATETAALVAVEGLDAVQVATEPGQPDETWVRWHCVSDFAGSGPRDRHYTIDPLSGEVRFGDGAHGLVPPPGQNNVRISYHTGGGEQGNRPPGTVVQLRSGVPYIDHVANHEAAQGGAPREPVERLRKRGPVTLRHRGRAVTAQDLEDLAVEASADVARSRAVVAGFDPTELWVENGRRGTAAHRAVASGRMGVIVVPDSPAARPTPTLGLLGQVRSYLQQRCVPTADLWVAGPQWVQVQVAATVVPASIEDADALRPRVQAALEHFLHPLTGGHDGQGWAFGRKPHRSELFAVVEAVPDLDHVVSLRMTTIPETTDPNLAERLRTELELSVEHRDVGWQPETETDRWLHRALVYSGTHQITVALAP